MTMMQPGHSPHYIALPAVLDLAAARPLSDQLRSLGGAAPVLLDAGVVETLTLPCIQVLLAAQKGGVAICIINRSAAFAAALEDLALVLADNWQHDGSIPTNEPAAEPQQPEAGGGPKKILTIDDSKTMRDMLMVTLADAGFDVLQGVDGRDGLDVLGDQQVDVIITDINMPRMDGYEVIRELRSNPVHKNTPILVLTTESDADKKMLARDVGATGWMVKPFKPERLLETVRKVSP
jgi:two-component system chemotaxis response regulator CheY